MGIGLVDDFQPTFTRVETIGECANLINLPHEDYPRRVDVTAEMIRFHIQNKHGCYLSETDVKAIQSHVMSDMKPRYRGMYRIEHADLRRADGTIIPLTAPLLIKSEIMEARLFPMWFTNFDDDSDIIDWYRTFQIIHPFKDGNGRAGGIAVAVASHYLSFGEYLLAPCQ